ncbi:MAG: Choline-sulfatase [bacterium ADurb.Bin429]|nr:MAG: Choline-sulfatase [bacterium ADurb.Bin429]
MKAIMVMFDSLNRRMLEPYGCDWVHTPNFSRLAERTACFDTSYVGSMPCMPARREIHTGRYNFLHRSWGPIEPFDDSMPEILKEHGIYTHLVSDHYHYWEEGGCNYHTRYSSWEIARGQEGEPWKGDLRPFDIPETLNGQGGRWGRQDWVNRRYLQREAQMPQPMTFGMGEEFLRTNSGEDNWFLHIETFDPHEPYFAAERFRELYPQASQGIHFDWPPYRRVQETPEQVERCRHESAALHSMCDFYMGRVIDLMDELDLWKDTLLIVNTDHGFLLGEHDWWAKCSMPFYDEVAHTPLFIWDPRCGVRGERRRSLVQTIDLPATLLDYFGVERPADMQGQPLAQTVADDTPAREAALFGLFGAHVNVTDGRYVYMRAPATAENSPINEYTLMPTHMRRTFGTEELQDIRIAEPFAFTKGCRTMQIGARPWTNAHQFGTMLFDLETDPHQEHPIQDAAVEQRMLDHMIRLMRDNDAPAEQYERLGVATAVGA